MLTNSGYFKVFLRKDRQAYITKVADPSSNPQEKPEVIPIPYTGIDQIFQYWTGFIFTTKGMDGISKLYNCTVADKNEGLNQVAQFEQQ